MTDDAQVSRVLVVGGGITGSTLALALARRGVRVVLVEARAEWAGIGHGITIQGNALRAFRSVGVLNDVLARGVPFHQMRLREADGGLIAELSTPHTGGGDLPATLGALRSDLAGILAEAVRAADVDVRLGTTVTAVDDDGAGVTATLSDGTAERADLLVGADGIRSRTRAMLGIPETPQPVGMGIWRVVAPRPPEMDCAEVYYNGPKFKAGYSPISADRCYAYLLEENLDPAFIGERPFGWVLKERSAGYGGTWGRIRDGIADDALVNYQWIEAILVPDPWFRGRCLVVGDAAHACPPLIAQGAAMCAEDAVVLAEILTSGLPVDEALPAFMARRFPRVKLVLDNSLQLAYWETHPGTPGADPGGIITRTLMALREPA